VALENLPQDLVPNLRRSASARGGRRSRELGSRRLGRRSADRQASSRAVRAGLYASIVIVLAVGSVVAAFAVRGTNSAKPARLATGSVVNVASPDTHATASPSASRSAKSECGKACAQRRRSRSARSDPAQAEPTGQSDPQRPVDGSLSGPPSSATGCVANPGACGYPDGGNTGIQAGVALTQVPSEATSGPGWHYSDGTVTVTGNVGSASTGLQLAAGAEMVVPDGVNNVTIDNVKLTGVSGANDNGITIGTNSCQSLGCGPNNITVENCYVHAVNDSNGAMGSGVYITWQSKSIAVKSCNIAGADGGIYYNQENGAEVTTGNYIYDPGASSTSQHLNGITSDAGPPDASSSWLIQDNTVLMTGPNGSQVTAAISLFPDYGAQVNANTIINGNLLDAGNYYLIDNGYGDAYGSSGQSYISITNNRLGDSGNNYNVFNYTWYIAPNLPGCEKNVAVACAGDADSGNVWDATGKSAE
jgi:hypothetical protein